MRKRILAITLVLTLMLSIVPVYGADRFSDVSTSSVFYNYINTARKLGIIDGYGDGTFRPNNTVTYGQFIKMAVKGQKADARGNTNWAAGCYYYALEEGLFGAGDIHVSQLDKPIPRAYMALILGNMLEKEGLSDPDVGYTEFTDVDKDYEYEYQIAQCYYNGIINGYSSTLFGVDDNLTRAQAAAVLVRMENLKEEKAEEAEAAAKAEAEKNPKEGYTYYEGYGWVKDEYETYTIWDGTYTRKLDSDPRSVTERMPKEQKAILDEIAETIQFTGSNGNYSFTYHHPEVPDGTVVNVQVYIYGPEDSEGIAAELYSYSSRAYGTYDPSDHTVTKKITGVSSVSGKYIGCNISISEKNGGQGSAYQYIQDYDGSIIFKARYAPASNDSKTSTSEFDKTEEITAPRNDVFLWK